MSIQQRPRLSQPCSHLFQLSSSDFRGAMGPAFPFLTCFFPGGHHLTLLRTPASGRKLLQGPEDSRTPLTARCEPSFTVQALASWRKIQRYYQQYTMVFSYYGEDTGHVSLSSSQSWNLSTSPPVAGEAMGFILSFSTGGPHYPPTTGGCGIKPIGLTFT